MPFQKENLNTNSKTSIEKAKNIKVIRSHAQAISQCQKIISSHKLETIISADTAGSAKFISKKQDMSEAAIASDLAAKIYDLQILKSNIKIISRKRFVNKKLRRKINSDEKFVYFPLQLEPERTLLISAPYYTDQIELIEKIAKSIPIDFLLYVKEHPRQGSEGWRDIKNYNKVLNLPNVKFLHPEVSNDFLLENCSLRFKRHVFKASGV